MKKKIRKTRKDIKYYFLFQGLKGLMFFTRIFPRKLVLWVCGKLGGLAYYLVKDARKKTIANLTLALSKEKSEAEILEIAKKVFVNLGKNGADVLRTQHITDLEHWKEYVETEGWEHFENAFNKGKGVICVTCHMGAFEMLATNMVLRGYPASIVGTELSNKRIDDFVVNMRTSRGVEFIHRGKDTIKLIKTLKRGEVVGMLIDQDTRVKSTFADFFGIPAYTPLGAALIALKTGAAVVPFAIRRLENDKHLISVKPEIEIVKSGDLDKDIDKYTQIFNENLEAFIRKDLTQWVWMHERWKTRPQDVAEREREMQNE
ncbi:lysophospholipid acyltransferase family protein [Flexithrix dorotheae]|uniref:lysophospholipid acyltransferase family protein n=1 Tax=Flexithrix dorotheae TaxID=70993 RepID=UPI0005C44CDB|nr:lysophospholipid acyltransferase family protein [Flexithrix dorotheae]